MRLSARPPSLGARALGVLVVVLCVHLLAPRVLAHARLIRSDPTPDVTLPSSPASVHLWFSEQLDPSASRLLIWNRDRHNVVRGAVQFTGSNTQEMVARVGTLTPGAYLVLWTSVSADDGHILRGSFLFYVKERGPGPSLPGSFSGGTGESGPDGPTLASILVHWVELFGAVVFVGTAALSAWVVRWPRDHFAGNILADEESRSRLLTRWALIVLIVSSTVLLILRAYELAGNDWSSTFTGGTLREALSGQYGDLWIDRQILALVCLLLTLPIPRWAAGRPGEKGSLHADRKAPLRVLTLLGLLYLYAFAASGHAASAQIGVIGAAGIHGDSLLSVSIMIDWLHFVADAIWLGGQVAIAVVALRVLLRSTPTLAAQRGVLAMLDRFSPFAYASVAFYFLTGGFNGKIHIDTWYAFFHSVYGWTLVVKMALIGLMMLVSMVTVYLLRPGIVRRVQLTPPFGTDAWPPDVLQLRRWLGVNPVLGAGALLATSVMFYYPVPPGLSPAGPGSYMLEVGGLHAMLRVQPDRSGPNTLTVTLKDAHGTLVKQAHVTVLTTMLDMPMGTGLAPLRQTGPGDFKGPVELGMGGHWRLQLLVFRPSGLTRMSIKIVIGT